MLKRMCIVALAYVLSSFGILLLLTVGRSGEFAGSVMRYSALTAWLVAWSAHLTMSFAWAVDHQLHRAWPAVGTFAAVFGLLSMPIGALLDSQSPNALVVGVGFASALFGLLLVSPCAILGAHLVQFHWKEEPVVLLGILRENDA